MPFSDLQGRFDFLIKLFEGQLDNYRAAAVIKTDEAVTQIRRVLMQFSVYSAQQRLQQLDWNAKNQKKLKGSDSGAQASDHKK